MIAGFQLSAYAGVFTTLKKGKYDSQEIWSPFYPGNIVKETDTVIIENPIEQNVDIVVKGTLVVKETASISGDRNVIIVKSGTLLNLGKSQFGLLTNRGAIYNQENIEVSLDFVNSGNVINHSKINVGNLLDNTGLLSGKGGDISASGRIINSRTGSIKGYLNICSGDFLNVEGASVDAQTTTFCGNPVFGSSEVVSQRSIPAQYDKSASNVPVRGGEYTTF